MRLIFISHDDVDHTGNLDEVLSACPHAQLVCNWAFVERYSNCFDFPLERCRWVMDGESFDVGDRTLLALRPPAYDSPTTRGLYDPSTRVYWAVDSFATPLPDPAIAVSDLDPQFWREALAMFALGAVSPWISLVDPQKYGEYVSRTQSLDIATIASCHSPVIEGPFSERVFGFYRDLPSLESMTLPDESVLDLIIQLASQPT